MKSKKNFCVGDKVFAKVKGYPPWPAIIDEIKGKRYSVTFYGTKETSKLKLEDLCDYIDNRDKITSKYSKKKGFLESIRELEEELSGTTNTGIDEDVYQDNSRINSDVSESFYDARESQNDETPVAVSQKRKKRSLSAQSTEDLPAAKRQLIDSRKSSTASNTSSRKRMDSPENQSHQYFDSSIKSDEDHVGNDRNSLSESNVNKTVSERDYEIIFADELYEKTKNIFELMERAKTAGGSNEKPFTLDYVNVNENTNTIELNSPSSKDDYDSDELVIDESRNLEEDNNLSIKNNVNFKDVDINTSNQLVSTNLSKKLVFQGMFNNSLISLYDRSLKTKLIQDFVTYKKHFKLSSNCVNLAVIHFKNILCPDTVLNQPKILIHHRLRNLIFQGSFIRFLARRVVVEDLNESNELNTKKLVGQKAEEKKNKTYPLCIAKKIEKVLTKKYLFMNSTHILDVIPSYTASTSANANLLNYSSTEIEEQPVNSKNILNAIPSYTTNTHANANLMNHSSTEIEEQPADSKNILDAISSYTANNNANVNLLNHSSTEIEEQPADSKNILDAIPSYIANTHANVNLLNHSWTEIEEQPADSKSIFDAISSYTANTHENVNLLNYSSTEIEKQTADSKNILNVKPSYTANTHANINLLNHPSIKIEEQPSNSIQISNVETIFNQFSTEIKNKEQFKAIHCSFKNFAQISNIKTPLDVINDAFTNLSYQSTTEIQIINQSALLIKSLPMESNQISNNSAIDNLLYRTQTENKSNLMSNIKSNNLIRIERENEIRIISPAHRTEITYNFMKERVELIEIDPASIKNIPNKYNKLLNHTSDSKIPPITNKSTNRLTINEIVTPPSNIRNTKNSSKRKSDSFTTVGGDTATQKPFENSKRRKSDSFPAICYNTRSRLEVSRNILKTKSVNLKSPICDNNKINRLKYNKKEIDKISPVGYNLRYRLKQRSNILKKKSDTFPIVNKYKRKFSENNDVQIEKKKRKIQKKFKFINQKSTTISREKLRRKFSENTDVQIKKKNGKQQQKLKFINQESTTTSIKKSRRSLIFKSHKYSNQNQDTVGQNFCFDKIKPEHSQNKHSNLKTIKKCSTKKYNNRWSIDNIKNSGNMATNVNSIANNVNRYYLRSAKNLENANENLINNATSSSSSKPIINKVVSAEKNSSKIQNNLKRKSNSTKNMAYHRRSSFESIDNTKSKQLKDLMNYLTNPKVDQFTKNNEYAVYIAQIHSHDQDIPELKIKPCNEPEYEYVDANIILDESDYGISDTSSDDDFINSADLTLTDYIKYYRMESFCQSKKKLTDEELIKKYNIMKGEQTDHENNQEKLDNDSKVSSHNRYTRLNDRVMRKRNKSDSKEMRAHIIKPLSQMSYDEINSLQEVDLISFLTLQDYIESKRENIPVKYTKKHDFKIELHSIMDKENIKRINSTNCRNNEDFQWLISNINCTTINNSKPNLRKHKLCLIKDYNTKDFDMPSTSGGDFITQQETKSYDSDSDSSIDENYIRVLNKQVRSKREQSNKSNDLCINFDKSLLNLDSITEEIVQRISEICLNNHNKTLFKDDNSDSDFSGFPSIEFIDNNLLEQPQLNSTMTIASRNDNLLKCQNYLENPIKFKIKTYLRQFSRNDLSIFAYNEHKKAIENVMREINVANNFDAPVTEKRREKDLLLIARTPEGEFIGIKHDTERPETFENEMARLMWTDSTIKNILRLKTQIEQGEILPNQKKSVIVTNPQLTIEERILAIEKCVVRRKQERLHWLQLESKLVEYDSEIKSYLGLEKADTEKALHCLEEILALPIEQLMLTKHPHVVDMVRRLRRYIGNIKAWDLSDEQTIEFTKGADQIRQKADEVYQKFKTLYETEHDKSFSDIYNSHVKEFNMKTKNMKEAQRFAVCAKPGTRQFEMDQMDDQLEIEAIKLKNELENKKPPLNEIQNATENGDAATSSM